jgi:hypothetical protein
VPFATVQKPPFCDRERPEPPFRNPHAAWGVSQAMRRTFTLAPVVLGAALLLTACGEDASDDEPPVAATSATASSLPQAGFGGVIEVTFMTDDAATQDQLASACGLAGGRRAGVPASPLPPAVRWYTEPADPATAIACMRRHEAVTRPR